METHSINFKTIHLPKHKIWTVNRHSGTCVISSSCFISLGKLPFLCTSSVFVAIPQWCVCSLASIRLLFEGESVRTGLERICQKVDTLIVFVSQSCQMMPNQFIFSIQKISSLSLLKFNYTDGLPIILHFLSLLWQKF